MALKSLVLAAVLAVPMSAGLVLGSAADGAPVEPVCVTCWPWAE